MLLKRPVGVSAEIGDFIGTRVAEKNPLFEVGITDAIQGPEDWLSTFLYGIVLNQSH